MGYQNRDEVSKIRALGFWEIVGDGVGVRWLEKRASKRKKCEEDTLAYFINLYNLEVDTLVL